MEANEPHTHNNHLFGYMEHINEYLDGIDGRKEPVRTNSLVWLHQQLTGLVMRVENMWDIEGRDKAVVASPARGPVLRPGGGDAR